MAHYSAPRLVNLNDSCMRAESNHRQTPVNAFFSVSNNINYDPSLKYQEQNLKRILNQNEFKKRLILKNLVDQRESQHGSAYHRKSIDTESVDMDISVAQNEEFHNDYIAKRLKNDGEETSEKKKAN